MFVRKEGASTVAFLALASASTMRARFSLKASVTLIGDAFASQAVLLVAIVGFMASWRDCVQHV